MGEPAVAKDQPLGRSPGSLSHFSLISSWKCSQTVLRVVINVETVPMAKITSVPSNQRHWRPGRVHTGLEMKREGSMHLVPAPAVRLMKSRVTSRPGNKVYISFWEGEIWHVDTDPRALDSRWFNGIFSKPRTATCRVSWRL